MQWLAIDFQNVLTSAVLGNPNPDPKKSGNKIKFQYSLEKLENITNTNTKTAGNPRTLMKTK